MICVDTSTWSEFFAGKETLQTKKLKHALEHNEVIMSPVVLCELLSSKELGKEIKFFLKEFQSLNTMESFWVFAGEMRSKVLAKGFKSKLPDCLIAQNCIENRVPLLTSDGDFRHYVPFGLDLV